MEKMMILAAAALLLVACEKPLIDGSDNGNVTLTFGVTQKDATRGTVAIGNYFSKLNVMLFDEDGNRAFEKVATQTIEDDGFGILNLSLVEGTYTVVAVGHSSARSVTVKSPVMVQFTASDGEKLTDTFCYCGTVTVGSDDNQYELTMLRATAMVQIKMTDEVVPNQFAKLVIGYTGGSANFNPTTLEGTTKSTQSEARQAAATYQVYTFPYMSVTGKLKMTLTAQDANGVVLYQRTIDDVPVTRNRITRYTGHIFDDTLGEITQAGFGFTVDGDWGGIDDYTF